MVEGVACNIELECFVEEWSKSGEKEKILLKRNGEAAFVTKNREGIVIIVPLDDFRSIFFVPIPLLLLFICDESFFLSFFSLIITITNGSTRIGSIIRNVANLITLFTARRQFQSLSTKAERPILSIGYALVGRLDEGSTVHKRYYIRRI